MEYVESMSGICGLHLESMGEGKVHLILSSYGVLIIVRMLYDGKMWSNGVTEITEI